MTKPSAEPQSNPWDRPPFPAKGDDDEKQTFEWVGRALSEWENFEANFGLVFGVFVGATEIEPAMRAYGSILTFRGRADMIGAAAEAFFVEYPDLATGEFREMINEANHYSPRRNEIAHGIVQPYYPDRKQARGTVVGPSRHATNKRKLTKKESTDFPFRIVNAYAYGAAELMRFTRRFGLLAQNTRTFHHNLFVGTRRLRKASP